MFVLLLLIVHLAFTFVSYFYISQYIKILFVLLFHVSSTKTIFISFTCVQRVRLSTKVLFPDIQKFSFVLAPCHILVAGRGTMFSCRPSLRLSICLFIHPFLFPL